MKSKFVKTLIAAAVAAPLAAQAGVDVFGKMDMSISRDTVEVGGVDSNETTMSGNESRLGIKAGETLGNGLNVFAVYTLDANIVDGADSPTTRNAFFGVKTHVGTFTAGNQNGESGSVAPLYNQANAVLFSVNDNETNSLIGARDGQNSFGYANTFGNLAVEARYALTGVSQDTTASTNKTREMEVAGTYNLGKAQVGAGYARQSGQDVTGDKSVMQLVGAYDVGQVQLGAITQRSKEAVGGETRTGMALSAKTALTERSDVIVSFGTAEVAQDVDADTFKVEADYKLSRTAKGYVSFANVDVDGGVEAQNLTAGFALKF